MPEALLFDLDGTLSETDSLHFPTWADAMLTRGVEVDWEMYGERIGGRPNPEIVADFNGRVTPRPPARASRPSA